MSDDLCGGRSCSGDTPVCKGSGASSQCVACLGNDDCSNAGTCNSSNACVCSARFNGTHCEFQVFRTVGTLQGDATSSVTCISHDGSVIAGISGSLPAHAFRSINGGTLEFIAEPTTLTPSVGCRPKAVDNSSAVLLDCEGKSFLHTTAGGTVAIDLPTSGYASDLSLDGKVLVGYVGSQGLRKVGSTNTLLGPLQPNSGTTFVATNADGTVAVGRDTSVGGVRWTAATGLVALEKLSGWNNYGPTDVSADGKVIVGSVDPNTTALAVKWSGAKATTSVLWHGQANAVNGDGSVVVGTDSEVTAAWIFDNAGPRSLQQLIYDSGTQDLGAHQLQNAFGVSDDGKFVVGDGGPSGQGWIAHLP